MSEQPNALVVVEVKGGCVQNTTAPDGIDVWVVDWDNLEGQIECPNCGDDSLYADASEIDRYICNTCGHSFHWEEEHEPDVAD